LPLYIKQEVTVDTSIKIAFSSTAIVLTFVAFVPYIQSILVGVTKPHVFSWIIWGTTTVMVSLLNLMPRAVSVLGR